MRESVLTAVGYALTAGPVPARAMRTDSTGPAGGNISIKSGKGRITAHQQQPDCRV